ALPNPNPRLRRHPWRRLQPTRSITYKTIGDRQLQLHIFEPASFKTTDKRTCYITIHGGGWVGMTPARMFPFADHFAKLGMVGISVQYRLYNAKTQTTVFDCVKDARTAVRYVRAHAADLGIDPTKIIVSGGSAGGISLPPPPSLTASTKPVKTHRSPASPTH
ncbi:alpha/beta hydrolase, partial [Verrucomicrobium spinosum]|uniref:alpha/beta hydrolase n=1 Tax=Verrucomicrobium spinosum TaxID=2736 RepID=UPI000AE2D42B